MLTTTKLLYKTKLGLNQSIRKKAADESLLKFLGQTNEISQQMKTTPHGLDYLSTARK